MDAKTNQALQHLKKQTESKSEKTPPPDGPTGSIPNSASKSPNQCEQCGGKGFFRLDVPVDHARFGKVVPCSNPAHKISELNRLNTLSQMNPKDTRLRLSDIAQNEGNKAMLQACKTFLKDPRGWLYIYGPVGNAKSIALRAMCNHLGLQGFSPVVYIKFGRLVEIMRQSQSAQYAKNQHYQQHGSLELWDNGYIDAFDRLLTIKVLAIEEFDKARITAFAEEFRFDFLDERYEQGIRGETITMFVSQSSPGELPGPIASRINIGKFTVVKNTAGDARPSEKW